MTVLGSVRSSKNRDIYYKTFTDRDFTEVDAWVTANGVELTNLDYDGGSAASASIWICGKYKERDIVIHVWGGTGNRPTVVMSLGGDIVSSSYMIKRAGMPIVSDLIGLVTGSGGLVYDGGAI